MTNILIVKYVIVFLLFMSMFVLFRNVLSQTVRRNSTRVRLQFVQQRKLSSRFSDKLTKTSKLFTHLNDLIESIQFTLSIGMFLFTTIFLCLFGFAVGAMFFRSVKGIVILSLILSSIPYLSLRFRLITQQMKVRMEFLPAVEVFYQYYVLSVNKNIRIVLQSMLQENRVQYPLKPIFQQFMRQLSVGRSPDDVFRIFTLAIGHHWGRYFSNILKVGMTEGVDVSENLEQLISDMRRARRNDQQEKNRLLEIRIANFSPILFLGAFLLINFRMNYTASVHYYFHDLTGRNLLLNALMLIFGSFLMGVYLSMRKM